MRRRRQGKVWVYRPEQHRTAHRGQVREIRFGPEAQKVLEPLLKPDLQAFIFSPIDAEAERRARLHAARTTPEDQGNRPGTNVKQRPQRKPRHFCNKDSYARAIARACDRADVWGKGGRVIGNEERFIPRWHPHQLRHNAATRLRRTHGLEAVGVILGHRTLAVTAHYTEQDAALAERVIAEVG